MSGNPARCMLRGHIPGRRGSVVLLFPWREPCGAAGGRYGRCPRPGVYTELQEGGRVTPTRPLGGARHAPPPPRISGGRAARWFSRHPPMLQGVPLERGQKCCGDCSTAKGEGAASPAGGIGRVSCAVRRGTTVPGEEELGDTPGVGARRCAAIAPAPAPGERRSYASAPRTAALQHRGQRQRHGHERGVLRGGGHCVPPPPIP